MRDSLHSSAMICFNWYDETIVSYRHELILNGLSRAAHQALERARDSRTQDRNLVTNTGQFRTRAIVELSAWQDLVSDACYQRIEISRQVFHELPQHRRVFAFSKNGSAGRHCLFTQACGLQDSSGIQACPFNA